MTRYICIHGHFYQPPRENPWLESVELQESARPYHDWNERVTAEAYTPNSASRILDDEGKIVRIVNNYERMSFNFGPTLLSWLEEKVPDTYKRILDADRESRNLFGGHGCAIAQAYNHMILPLADQRDKQTQIRWGIADFRRRFGREPEGMWLPETAADVDSLEALAAEGIRFTILAPGQAKRIRRRGEMMWEDVGGNPDTKRAYLVQLPSGRRIHVFFYDGSIARSVAFEKLLQHGDSLVNALIGAFGSSHDGSPLVHFATDGETYGHHHPWGDMALAWALDQIEQRDDVELTNYGQFLEHLETEWEAEIVEPSSWSCAHGVERWRSDCGCQTGGQAGWNQAWRAPLRDALDWLRDTVRPLYEAAAGELLADPWAARDDYVDVILDRREESVDAFLAKHRRSDLSPDDGVAALELLEMQRHAMLMYTSCGWFFNDVSGIETVQVLQYAGRVVQLAEKRFQQPLEAEMLTRLANAKSNIAEEGDAAKIWEKSVRPAVVDLQRVAAHYAVATPFEIHEPDPAIYCYDVHENAARELRAGRSEAVVGHISVSSRITRETGEFTIGVLYLGDLDLTGGVRAFRGLEGYEKLERDLAETFDRSDVTSAIRVLDRELGSMPFSINSLFTDERRTILGKIWTETLTEAEGAWRQLYDRYVPLMRLHARTGIPLPRILKLAAEFSVNMALRRELERDRLDLALIRSLLDDAKLGAFDLDRETLAPPLERAIEQLSRFVVESAETRGLLDRFLHVLELVGELPFKIDLWRAQNAYFLVQQKILPSFVARASDGDARAGRWIAKFERLGERLGIQSDWDRESE